jgi:hypothetical protein
VRQTHRLTPVSVGCEDRSEESNPDAVIAADRRNGAGAPKGGIPCHDDIRSDWRKWAALKHKQVERANKSHTVAEGQVRSASLIEQVFESVAGLIQHRGSVVLVRKDCRNRACACFELRRR